MPRSHPYIPSSVPAVRDRMLAEIGAGSVDELYASIPERLRFRGRLDLPEPIAAEAVLERHLRELLGQNESCAEVLNFRGAGCWQHYVPAICDEVNQRGEFLTAYSGEQYTDHGKYQAFFEYASLVGELVEMDAVSLPVFDWGWAASTSLKMAGRITGRGEVVVPRTTSPERLATVHTHCARDVDVIVADDVAAALSDRTAAVYVEVPSYLGTIDERVPELGALAHERGALFVVGVDPISLGVLAAPGSYGADIVCGELQPLGIHMHYGGGTAGFIASPDTAEYVSEYPTFLFGLTTTSVEGELGFGYVDWERTSYVKRASSPDFGGTTTALWAITAAVYLAAVGPEGLAELGRGIMQRSRYAARRLAEIDGVTAPALDAPFFKEFVVSFDGTGKTVAEVNRALREHGIFGGKDLAQEFPELGQSALYCVTEIHTKFDLDRLGEAVAEAVQ